MFPTHLKLKKVLNMLSWNPRHFLTWSVLPSHPHLPCIYIHFPSPPFLPPFQIHSLSSPSHGTVSSVSQSPILPIPNPFSIKWLSTSWRSPKSMIKRLSKRLHRRVSRAWNTWSESSPTSPLTWTLTSPTLPSPSSRNSSPSWTEPATPASDVLRFSPLNRSKPPNRFPPPHRFPILPLHRSICLPRRAPTSLCLRSSRLRRRFTMPRGASRSTSPSRTTRSATPRPSPWSSSSPRTPSASPPTPPSCPPPSPATAASPTARSFSPRPRLLLRPPPGNHRRSRSAASTTASTPRTPPDPASATASSEGTPRFTRSLLLSIVDQNCFIK